MDDDEQWFFSTPPYLNSPLTQSPRRSTSPDLWEILNLSPPPRRSTSPDLWEILNLSPSPRHSPSKGHSPRRSPKGRSPSKERSPRRSPKGRSPSKERSPRRSPKGRSPKGRSPKGRSPSKERSPRRSPKGRSPRRSPSKERSPKERSSNLYTYDYPYINDPTLTERENIFVKEIINRSLNGHYDEVIINLESFLNRHISQNVKMSFYINIVLIPQNIQNTIKEIHYINSAPIRGFKKIFGEIDEDEELSPQKKEKIKNAILMRKSGRPILTEEFLLNLLQNTDFTIDQIAVLYYVRYQTIENMIEKMRKH